MRKKAIGGIIVGVLVILICLVFIFTKNNNSQVKQQSNNSQVGIKIKKNKHRNSVRRLTMIRITNIRLINGC